MSQVKLKEEVLDVLKESNISENLLILPDKQLERKLYEDVAKAIKLAGGKWTRGKGGFVFNSDPREKLGMAINNGTIVNEKKLRQAFYTPESIADEIVLIAGVANCDVLEPSAGDGNLVKSLIKFGAKSIDCVEIEESCRKNLMEIGANVVIIDDFLSCKPFVKFDRIVMNPPFTKNQYLKHITHAIKYLKPEGKLFAVVPNNNCQKLKDLGCSVIRVFQAGSFKESGTMVATALVAYEN